jgi:hypothetical protein
VAWYEQEVDQEFEEFLLTSVTVLSIEQRLDKHANFFYSYRNQLPDCKIWFKIQQILSNGTIYPITGYPIVSTRPPTGAPTTESTTMPTLQPTNSPTLAPV